MALLSKARSRFKADTLVIRLTKDRRVWLEVSQKGVEEPLVFDYVQVRCATACSGLPD